MTRASPRWTRGSLLTLAAALAFAWGSAAQAQTFTSGVADNFVLPTEPTSPSAGLLTWIGNNYPNPTTRQNDQQGDDRYYATTFTGLTRRGRICGATLRTTIRSNDWLNNDGLGLWFVNSAGQLTPGWGSSLSGLGIGVGQTVTVTLNLAALPGGTNLLPALNTHGYLDVILQDDSAIDFVSLTVTQCKTDIYMMDLAGDVGVEPGAYPSTSVWNSPDIRVCQTAGCVGHQNPEFGQPNYVYVTLRHTPTSSGSIPGTLMLYYTASGGAALWHNTTGGDWTFIGSASGTMPPSGTIEVPITWNNVPAPGHYCLLARWVSSADPMTFGEPDFSNTLDNTRKHNNIAWKNVNVVNLSPFRPAEDFNFRIRNLLQDRDSEAALEVRVPADRPFMELGQVRLRLPQELWERWSGEGHGFEIVGEGELLITDPAGAWLGGLTLEPDGAHNVVIQFVGESFEPQDEPFEVQLVQHSETPEGGEAGEGIVEVGGVSYQIVFGDK